MDNYLVQRHLESLCKARYIADSELKRLAENGYWNGNKDDILAWKALIAEDDKHIEKCIENIKNRNIKIIVTEEEVLYSLINFLAGKHIEDYDIINLDERFESLYPKSEAAQLFMEGYKNKDFRLVSRAYRMIN